MSIKTDLARLLDLHSRLGTRYAIRRTVDALYVRTIGTFFHPQKRRGILALSDIKDRFTKIYEANYWNSGESRSGAGSTLDAADLFGTELESFLLNQNIESILDAPCGDWNWMRRLRLPTDCIYIGGDIVRPLIDELSSQFGGDKVSFAVFDITANHFPDVELWLCRDCLFHLSFRDIFQTLKNFSESKCKYALITSHYAHSENLDIISGDFRYLNLTKAPFNLPEPSAYLRERLLDEPRYVGLWSRTEIREHLMQIASASGNFRATTDASK
jgi:hypothetical protein